MTAATDPFGADVDARLADDPDVTHVHRLVAYRPADGLETGRELAIASATLTADEDTTPRYVLNASVVLEDQALADLLDPRTGARVAVAAGYRYADRSSDVQTIADLGIDDAIARRPADEIQAVAVSDEQRVMQYPLTAPVTYSATTPVRTVLAALLTAHGGDPAAITARRAATQLGESLTVEPGREWDAIEDLVNRIDAVVYHNGRDAFVVEDQPLEAGAAVARLETGRTGTLTDTEVARTRLEFANRVIVEYRWRDGAGVDQVRRGWAEVAGGPYGTDTGVVVGRVLTLERPGTVAAAQAVAAAALPRTISRGRRAHVEAARALYWLRPGVTVTLRFPLGGDERHIVSRVTYDLPAGTMSVTTRQPETVTIETGV